MAYSGDNGVADDYEDDYAYYEKKKPKRSRRRVGEVISTIVILVIIALLILVVVNAPFRESIKDILNPSVGGYREYPEWAEFEVERSITVSPYNPSYPMDYDIDIPEPKDIPESNPWLQDVKSIVSSPDRTEVKFNNYTWMVWEGDDVPSQRTFRIRYSIATESAVWSVDRSESGTIDDIPQWEADRFGNKTREEWVIIPDHPEIKALSDDLTKDKITVYDKLWAIFDHMNRHYEYVTQRSGEPKFCNMTLRQQSGDCDDQSVLFISLARAAGLPSMLEFGALYNQQKGTWGGHAWVRVYIPDYLGQEGFWYNIDIVNDHFLFRDSLRFSEWVADGNGTHLKDYYYSYGSNFRYDENYNTLSMKKSSKTIKIGEDGRPINEVVPGFEGILLVTAVVAAVLIMRRKRNF
ncbi:MAG: transglutaminase domain-containing protein [Thermoplasmata archaeon]|nr:MAG: transglutaminase domain-containing protein [Thermoplasmata archaeon]